jgi:hypothetical protein
MISGPLRGLRSTRDLRDRRRHFEITKKIALEIIRGFYSRAFNLYWGRKQLPKQGFGHLKRAISDGFPIAPGFIHGKVFRSWFRSLFVVKP